MEDIRSNPNEENLESSESKEEKETLDQATHEAEAHVERTGGHEQAEVIEGLVKDMVKGAPEAVDPTQPPGTSDAKVEEIAEPEGGDDATPINLPDTQQTDLEGATPLPIPKGEDKAGDISEIEEIDKSDLIDLPDTKKVDISATPLPIPKKGTVSKWEFDPPPEHEREEAIVGTAPSEMPPELEGLDPDEAAGFKFYKPIPADEESAKFKGEPAMVKGEIGKEPVPPDPDPDYTGMVKGDVGMEPEPPDPDPDIRPDEVVGMKFHSGEEVSGPDSPGIDQVSKVDSFTKEGELREPVIGENIPDVESPAIADISDEVSKDPAYLEASERDIADVDSSPPEGDEIEEGD